MIFENKYCQDFNGGFCDIIKGGTSRSWCFDVCKGNWNGHTINTKKTMMPMTDEIREFVAKYNKKKRYANKNNVINMARNFALAMLRAAKEGFKTVDEETFIERMMCCTTCGDGSRCPYCGCLLKLKDRLKSERECPNKKTYPKIKTYPPRNFWSVCDETTTAIITERKEPVDWINKTVKSLKENATGKLEIIVVLDGDDYELSDKNVIVIKNKKPLGRRVSINNAVKKASGTYLFFCDAHCTMSEGWDTKLKCAADMNTIAVSCIDSIDENFETKNKGKYRYCALNSDLVVKWWGKYAKRTKKTFKVNDTMAFTGCGWMIRKETYNKFGGFDESLGHWGHLGEEWSLKMWCNNGRVALRNDVFCGHIFGTNTDAKNFKPAVISNSDFCNKMYATYGNKIDSLVNRFRPVPDWTQKTKFITIIKPTDDSVDKSIYDYCHKILIDSVSENNQIIISKKLPEKARGILTLYQQLLDGCNATRSEYIFIAEQDVLYHKAHFDFVPPRKDVFYYDVNVFMLAEKGFVDYTGRTMLSMLVCNRALLLEYLNDVFSGKYNIDCFDPGCGSMSEFYKTRPFKSRAPSIDIKHGGNETNKVITTEYIKTIPDWGNYKKLWTKLKGV